MRVVFYYTIAFHLVRTDFVKLITLFGGLFFLCFKLIQFEKWNFKFLLIVGVLFRLVFLLTEPTLSQDYFRFIWDGELILNSINPYIHLPNTLIEQIDLGIANAQQLHQGMGELSARHYSNYPPLNQLLFALASFFGGKSILGSVIGMRILIILSDIGILYFGRKLLKNLNLSPHLIFWYYLNPLVIIELTGNLHFEGVMLSLFVISLYLLSIDKWKLAAVLYALSISIKLVPLLFLPLFLTYFGFKRSMGFYGIIGIVSILLLAPFYSPEFLSNYTDTVGLWFSNFEFNAGFYNSIEQLGLQFELKPWKLIKTYGKITPFVIILLVLLITFFRKNQQLSVLISSMLLILTAYYFLATTVHPWYVVFLVLLSIFTRYRYSIIWSLMIVLSYFAYSQENFKEHLGILAIEYIAVYGFLIFELFKFKGQNLLIRKN